MSLRAWSVLMLVAPLAAGCSPERKPLKIVFTEGFEGGAAIVWDVGPSPALPADGSMLVVEVPKDGIVQTSSPLQTGKIKDELYWRKGTTLVPIPFDQQADRTTGSHRSCGSVEQFFIGDKAKLAAMKTTLGARLDGICGGSSTPSPSQWVIPAVDPEVGIGQARLGMTRAELDKLGLPIKEGPPLEVGSYRVLLEADHVVSIEVSLASQPEGIRIGGDVVPTKEKDLAKVSKGLPGCGKVDVKIGASDVACAGGAVRVKATGPDQVVTIEVMTKERAAKATP